MANNYLAGTAFLSLYWTLGGNLAVNRIGLQVAGAVTFGPGLADQLGAGIKSAFTTHLGPRMPGNVSLVRVGVRDWSSPGRPEFRDSGGAVIGSAITEMLPAHVALCVTLRTALAGKSFRGRVYLGGWAEAENTADGLAAATASTAATGFMNAVDVVCSAADLPICVISRPSDDVKIVRETMDAEGNIEREILSHTKAKPGGFTDVVAYESRTDQWESQRRRVNGRGGGVALLNPVSRVEAS